MKFEMWNIDLWHFVCTLRTRSHRVYSPMCDRNAAIGCQSCKFDDNQPSLSSKTTDWQTQRRPTRKVLPKGPVHTSRLVALAKHASQLKPIDRRRNLFIRDRWRCHFRHCCRLFNFPDIAKYEKGHDIGINWIMHGTPLLEFVKVFDLTGETQKC